MDIPSRRPRQALRPCGLLLLAACAWLPACRPAGEPPPSPAREPVAVVTPAPSSSPARFLGSAGCADCHAEQARLHAASSHALDFQTPGETPSPTGAGRPVDDASVVPTQRLGTRRRLDWLAVHEGSLQVLPRSWSLTQEAWVDRRLEEGEPAAGDESWTGDDAAWRGRCAGCHPNAAYAAGREVPLSPEAARGLPPGIGCEHCHGAGAEHARLARETPDAHAAIAAAIVRAGPSPWDGCDHCHAAGEPLPLRPGEALRAGDALADHRLSATAINSLRPDGRFFADGRPGRAHGLSVQSLAQSRCFRAGELRCLTCHDPHGGGLRENDPDASCRNCHAGAASDGHSGHPAPSAPVPLAREEPNGPAPTRAPGCVDCHAPALLTFGSEDRVRDHAFAIPEPELTRDFGMPDACGSCHDGEDPQRLVDWLDERTPDRKTPRHDRAAAFRRILELAPIGESEFARDAVPPLLGLLSDEEADPWLRASAASALATLGAEALDAAPALTRAASSASPELAQAAAAALGKIGTTDLPGLVRVARSHPDWRVRLVAAASLDALGDADGSAELEVLAASAQLPTAAHAQARLQLGLAWLRRGLLERAAFQLDESIRLDGTSVPAWLNLGVARAGLGDEEGARLAWLTVVDLEPGNLAALANLEILNARESDATP